VLLELQAGSIWLVYTKPMGADERDRITACMVAAIQNLAEHRPNIAAEVFNASLLIRQAHRCEHSVALMAAYSALTVYHEGPVTRPN
jgi:hypothetical protein